MSVKRLALTFLVMAAGLGAAAPAYALNSNADTTWMTNGKVFALAKSGTTLYVGGKFAKEVSPDGLTKYSVKSLGSYDLATGTGIKTWHPQVALLDGTKGTVNALALSPDGSTLFVGGSFDLVNGVPAQNFAAVSTADGSIVPGWSHSFNQQIHVILVGPNLVYIGGAFTKVDGIARDQLAALTMPGDLSSWAPSADDTVRSMALAPDGTTMFIGGNFTTMDGVSRQSVARVTLDTGALDPWAIPSGVIVGPQVGWALLPVGNRLYGGFGRGPNYVAAFRLDNGTSGTQVWRFNTVGNVESLAMSNDGTRLFFGGHFGTARLTQTVCGNQPLHGLASINPSNGVLYCDWFPAITPFGKNFTGAWTLLSTGTKLWVGGFIDAINGVTHEGLARFTL